jgi:hypothetical protein
MWSMMWCTGFGIHTNNDPKKACNLWHAFMIPQGIGLVYLLILGGLTPALSGGPHVQTPAEKTAYAVARLLQCVVRSPAPVPEPRMTDQGGDRAWSRGAVGVLRCPVLGVLPVLEVPLSWPTRRRAGRRLLVS